MHPQFTNFTGGDDIAMGHRGTTRWFHYKSLINGRFALKHVLRTVEQHRLKLSYRSGQGGHLGARCATATK